LTAPIHVLVYGALDSGITDSLRIGCFVEPLSRLGVEVRSWQSFADDLLGGGGGGGGGGVGGGGGGSSSSSAHTAPPSAQSDADFLRDSGLTALAWADVVVFRRWRSTHLVCSECERAFDSEPALAAHVRSSNHRTLVPDLLLRPIVELIATHPELLGERAVVYDTDDDVLDYPDWTGLGPAARRERDLAVRILGMADMVTAATPVLADRLRPLTRGEVRVIRNAVDPAWYVGTAEPGLIGDPRVLYHGVPVRLRDYEVARPAVDAVAAAVPGMRRVWLGAAHEPRVVACMDEVRPWVDGLAAFGGSLVAARPDIGLAPLLDESFNRAKSELHWLEYAMAGAPTIATSFGGPGPYDVIRDGTDGLLARTPADWERHLRRLAVSPAMRGELAGRARERVIAEYTVAGRAAEWAEAFGWASSHGGIGRANSGAVGDLIHSQ
jgi:glycosyltransferase involved in cell wall biosynthesis